MGLSSSVRKKESTQEVVLDAAERLFGRHGVDAVSLREIAVAAGSSNHFVVQYHFGDKARLIREIFERRMPSLEQRRGKLLSEARKAGRGDMPEALMEILLRPLGDERDREGMRSYAAFVGGMRHFEKNIPPFNVTDLQPLTNHVRELLASALPDIPAPLLAHRLRQATSLFIANLVDRDRRHGTGPMSGLSEEEFMEEALAEATATLMAPVPAGVAASFARAPEA